VTVDSGSADAVLLTAATRLTAGVEAGDDLTLSIQYLGLPVDPKAAVGIEHSDACCRRVEGRRIDPMQDRLLKIFVHAFSGKRVISRHRLLQVLQRHLMMGMFHDFL